jgi:hypothetical protein
VTLNESVLQHGLGAFLWISEYWVELFQVCITMFKCVN